MEGSKFFTTHRKPNIIAGDYSTDFHTLAEASSAVYPQGTVLVMDDTTGKLKVFSSDTAVKAHYDLFVLLEEEVTADKDKKVAVITRGRINAGALILNKSGDKLTTAVNGCQIEGWLGNKFELVHFENRDNIIKE
ncbi:hypothetical protein [Brachyspira pulli]|uniref:hypothetical protein n=1 Tax=Brachyspira pulli TaxID=310721 RepID=UPI00300557B2